MVDLHHKNYRWEMSELVVKDNALINASYNLDLTEQRLILLAIVEARESGKGINANDPLNIHAESYINQFGVHRNTAYQALKDACDDLCKTIQLSKP
jgi:plasmid replication initiation protein